jgi:hypothetical protein
MTNTKTDATDFLHFAAALGEDGGPIKTVLPTFYAYPRTPEIDFRIALHEGGHILCGKYFGFPVEAATIVADPINGFGGMVSGNKDRTSLLAPDRVVDLCVKIQPLMPQIGESRTDVAEFHAHAHYRIVELLGGTEAERLFHTDDPPLQAAHDLQQAEAFAALICSPASIAAFIEFARIEARAILTDHRHVVFALAHALVEHRTLEGSDRIDQIIADAISAHAIAIEQKRQAAWQRAAFGLSRCSARIMPIRANIVGPSCSATSISACTVAYGWLQVKCHRCETSASIPLEHVRRPRDTPIWKLEAALRCRSCGARRYRPPVHMIKLTQQREITPYLWVHPDDDERR